MKNFISDAIDVCKNFEISKSYDCRTELKNSEQKEPYFIMHTKGNFTVKPIHLAIGLTAIGCVYLVSSLRHRACSKKS